MPETPELWELSVEEIAAKVRSREISADEARERAAALDRRIAAGEDPGPLAGVPVALKDNLSLDGHALTCGSRILTGYVAPYTATAVERLLAAGAVPLGRNNMDEVAMGSSCENSAWPLTRRPPARPGVWAPCREAPAGAPRGRWPPAVFLSRSGRTRAVPSASRPRCAV